DDVMVITLNSDDLPEWIDDGLLGVDVMFDEMTYREMEYTLKEVIKSENNRVAELKEILLGNRPARRRAPGPPPALSPLLNASQRDALAMVLASEDVAFIHGPPGTGKTTTLIEAIRCTILEEKQVLVCAPSNAAVDLLVDKLSELGLQVMRIGHPARVTEQSLSKTLDHRITSHPSYKELRNMRRR